MTADDENRARREDPWMLARVEEVLEERRRLIRSLQPHVRAMEEIAGQIPYNYVTEDVSVRLDRRVTDKAYQLSREVTEWRASYDRPPTEIYIRNVAGFEMGREIARREKFNG